MTTLISSSCVWFGHCPRKPLLPEGFKYREREGEWLLAERGGESFFVEWSEDSDFVWLIPRRVATWWDQLRTWGRLKRGMIFADDRLKLGFLKTFEEKQ